MMLHQGGAGAAPPDTLATTDEGIGRGGSGGPRGHGRQGVTVDHAEDPHRRITRGKATRDGSVPDLDIGIMGGALGRLLVLCDAAGDRQRAGRGAVEQRREGALVAARTGVEKGAEQVLTRDLRLHDRWCPHAVLPSGLRRPLLGTPSFLNMNLNNLLRYCSSMPTPTAPARERTPLDLDGVLTIGQLAARTGLTPEVLRMWESRHAFPVPVRLPSGHRRYTEADVDDVLRVLRLREGGLHLEQAIRQVRSSDDAVEASVYAVLRHRYPDLPSYTLTKQTLLALSWAIEDESLAQARRPLLIGAFQSGRYFAPSQRRWRELARSARSAYVLAELDDPDDAASPRRVGLPPDAPLLREWIVVVDDPGLTAAMVAWEIPGQAEIPDRDRLFEAVWSLEPDVVRTASLASLAIAADAGSLAATPERVRLAAEPLPAPTSQRIATELFNRMVAYADGTILMARRGR